MVEQWHDPNFAFQWDQTALVGNPTRAEQLDILLSLLVDLYTEGTTILDLGMGSGLVEAQLFARLPNASVTGVEPSQAMLDLARPRLAPFAQQLRIIQCDLVDLQDALPPAETYPLIFSVQVFHHCPHAVQQALFQTIFDLLPTSGVFLFMDRIELVPEDFSGLYQTMWERLELAGQSRSGWSGQDFLHQLQGKEDYPARPEDHLAWLRAAGFAATCLHLHLNRALLVGVKKPSEKGSKA